MYLALYVVVNIVMFNLQYNAFDFIGEKVSVCSSVLLSPCSDCAEEWGGTTVHCVSNIEHEPPDEFYITARA